MNFTPAFQAYGPNPPKEAEQDHGYVCSYVTDSNPSDSGSNSTRNPTGDDTFIDAEEDYFSSAQSSQISNASAHSSQMSSTSPKSQIPSSYPMELADEKMPEQDKTDQVAKMAYAEPELMSKLADYLETMGHTMERVSNRVGVVEKNQDSIVSNQKLIHLRTLELDNEIQRSKIYSRNRIHSLIKDLSIRDYEKANLVIYNLAQNDLDHFTRIYHGDEDKAIFKYGLNFVNHFWAEPGWPDYMKYNPKDLKVIKLAQGKSGDTHAHEKTGPGFFRILLKMATPDDATRLKKRCLNSGFHNVRPGLSPGERDTASACETKVAELNGLLDKNSKTCYVRKFVFSIAEVDKKNHKKVHRFVEWLKQEDLFDSTVNPLNLIDVPLRNHLGTGVADPANNPLNRVSSDKTTLTIRPPTPSATGASAILPPAPTSPFQPKSKSTTPPPSNPVGRPKQKQKPKSPTQGLPSTTSPSFQYQNGKIRIPPQTPNSRGDFDPNLVRNDTGKLNLTSLFKPCYIKSGFETTGTKRKATSPKGEVPKRKKVPELSLAEKQRRNKLNNEKRKKKLAELKKAKEEEDKKKDNMILAMQQKIAEMEEDRRRRENMI